MLYIIMSISIIHNKKPNLKRPDFLVDGILDERLNQYEITKLLNKSHTCLFCGPPGSGKTSMIVGLINTPPDKGGFKKIFHTIYLFMGSNSRSSIKGNLFDKQLPPDQIFDEMTPDILDDIYDRIKEDSAEGYRSLIICDDIQRFLREYEVEKRVKHLCANRRHLKLCLWFANQQYKSLSPSIRAMLSNIFIWKVNKREMENIFNEQIEQHKEKFNDVLKLLFKEPHDFFFIDTNSQRLFNNWDEIIIPE
jgi:GTPase SAR1 family protein